MATFHKMKSTQGSALRLECRLSWGYVRCLDLPLIFLSESNTTIWRHHGTSSITCVCVYMRAHTHVLKYVYRFCTCACMWRPEMDVWQVTPSITFHFFLKQGLSFNREFIRPFCQAGWPTGSGYCFPSARTAEACCHPAFPWMLGTWAQITHWAVCTALVFLYLQQLYYTRFPHHEIHMIQTEDILTYPLLASNASLRCIH